MDIRTLLWRLGISIEEDGFIWTKTEQLIIDLCRAVYDLEPASAAALNVNVIFYYTYLLTTCDLFLLYIVLGQNGKENEWKTTELNKPPATDGPIIYHFIHFPCSSLFTASAFIRYICWESMTKDGRANIIIHSLQSRIKKYVTKNEVSQELSIPGFLFFSRMVQIGQLQYVTYKPVSQSQEHTGEVKSEMMDFKPDGLSSSPFIPCVENP